MTILPIHIPIPGDLQNVLDRLPSTCQPYIVGGFVRDFLLGVNNTDIDIEVFGISYADLNEILSRFGRTDLVGKSFGVIKLTLNKKEYDFSIPRRDSNKGAGHRDFLISFDKDITLEDAARRRDFTINSLYYNHTEKKILDPFGGLIDLNNKKLHYIDKKAFQEDPLRVLRAMQFSARFSLLPSDDLVEACREISHTYDDLPKERVWAEFEKLATKSLQPSLGIYFLIRTNWVKHFPEIEDMIDCPQDPVFHPEREVLLHTCHCLDHLVTLPDYYRSNRERRAMLFFAVLCHDMAKPITTRFEFVEKHNRIVTTSKEHEQKGGKISKVFLNRINGPKALSEAVKPLVMNHLAHLQTGSPRSVRRLSTRLQPSTIADLITVIAADHGGRPPLPKELPEQAKELRRMSKEMDLENKAPEMYLKGRHLIDIGLKSGKIFGSILHAAFEAQLDGAFDDEAGALIWLKVDRKELIK